MIPKICANCMYALNIFNDGGIAMSLCSFLPIVVAKHPGDTCGQFKMADEPAIQEELAIQDIQETDGEDIEE